MPLRHHHDHPCDDDQHEHQQDEQQRGGIGKQQGRGLTPEMAAAMISP